MVIKSKKNDIILDVWLLVNIFGFQFKQVYSSQKKSEYNLEYGIHRILLEYEKTACRKILKRWKIDNDVFYVNKRLKDFIMICKHKYDMKFKIKPN
jgi:hypothetical protein